MDIHLSTSLTNSQTSSINTSNLTQLVSRSQNGIEARVLSSSSINTLTKNLNPDQQAKLAPLVDDLKSQVLNSNNRGQQNSPPLSLLKLQAGLSQPLIVASNKDFNVGDKLRIRVTQQNTLHLQLVPKTPNNSTLSEKLLNSTTNQAPSQNIKNPLFSHTSFSQSTLLTSSKDQVNKSIQNALRQLIGQNFNIKSAIQSLILAQPTDLKSNSNSTPNIPVAELLRSAAQSLRTPATTHQSPAPQNPLLQHSIPQGNAARTTTQITALKSTAIQASVPNNGNTKTQINNVATSPTASDAPANLKNQGLQRLTKLATTMAQLTSITPKVNSENPSQLQRAVNFFSGFQNNRIISIKGYQSQAGTLAEQISSESKNTQDFKTLMLQVLTISQQSLKNPAEAKLLSQLLMLVLAKPLDTKKTNQNTQQHISNKIGALINSVQSAINATHTNQLRSALSLLSENQTPSFLQLDIPFRFGENIIPVHMQLQFEKEKSEYKKKNREKTNRWKFCLEWELENEGKFSSEISFSGGRVNASLWAENDNTRSKIHKRLSELREKLSNAGIDVETLQCVQSAHRNNSDLNHHSFVDIKT
ncbi:MAG: hypothetical protein ACI93R_000503 [Flavobacteriales bacterium]|jgi:hypothetical protein